MKRLLWHWIISSIALWLAALALQGGVHIDHWYTVLWLAPLLGVVNTAVGAVVGVISWFAAPANLMTLGCMGFVLSCIGYVTAVYFLGQYVDDFRIDNPSWSIALAVVMGLFSSLLNMLLPGKDARRR